MKCEDCKFSVAEDETDYTCRRYSPKIVAGMCAVGGSQYHADVIVNDWCDSAVWPVVLITDWCGEFKPKEAEIDSTFIFPNKYKSHAEEIIKIIRLHKNNPWQIVKGLRKLGVIAKSTYWRDVRFYKPIVKILNEREEHNG